MQQRNTKPGLYYYGYHFLVKQFDGILPHTQKYDIHINCASEAVEKPTSFTGDIWYNTTIIFCQLYADIASEKSEYSFSLLNI